MFTIGIVSNVRVRANYRKNKIEHKWSNRSYGLNPKTNEVIVYNYYVVMIKNLISYFFSLVAEPHENGVLFCCCS